MKKLLLILCIALIMTPLFSFGRVVAEENADSAFDAAAFATKVDSITLELCKNFKDRTSFTEACGEAAEGIKDALSRNDKLTATVQEYTQSVMVAQGFGYTQKDITSYNVVARPKQRDASKKTILLTTPFANHYSDNEASKGVKAEGALYNAATTSFLLALSEELTARTDALYNFMFAFFSGTDEGNFGSRAFADELDSDVMLVINFDRIGCYNTYFYTDEVDTEHGKFVRELAKDYELVEFPTTGRVNFDLETVDGLPYSNYAMRGDISTFLSLGKSCLEFIGGDFSGLLDGETILSNSSLDTYERLIELFPDYKDKLAEVGEFVVDLTSKSELQDKCLGAATSYKVFAQRWIAYVICLGIIVVLILIMILVIRHLEKKYPLPTAPKVKIAVFGKEYEDIGDNDIIIDFKKSDETNNDNNGNNNPFDI